MKSGKKKWKTKKFTPMVVFGIIAFSTLIFMIVLPGLAGLMFMAAGKNELSKFFFAWAGIGFILYIIIGMIGGPVMAGLYIKRWINRKKPTDHEKIMAWAKKRGYEFQAYDTEKIMAILRHTPMYAGTNKKATNVVSASYKGRDIYNCEWFCLPPGLAPYQKQFRLTFFITAIYSGLSGGKLDVRPESMVDSALDIIGVKDIEFENKEFNDRFNIAAKPKKFGYDFFQPIVMQHFIDSEMVFCMSIRNGWIYIYAWFGEHQAYDFAGTFNSNLTYEDWLEAIPDFAMELTDLLPKYTKKATKVEPLDETIITIVCPVCDTAFKVWQGKKNIQCPKCNAEGEI